MERGKERRSRKGKGVLVLLLRSRLKGGMLRGRSVTVFCAFSFLFCILGASSVDYKTSLLRRSPCTRMLSFVYTPILFLSFLSLYPHCTPSPSLLLPQTHANPPFQRVAVAARSVLGTSVGIAHEALLLSVDWLDLAPIPGLRAAAQTLLYIWDSLQQVDVRIFLLYIFPLSFFFALY